MRPGLEKRLTKAVVSAITGGLAGAIVARKRSPRDDSKFVVYGLIGAGIGFIIGFLTNRSLRNPWA